MSLVVVVWLVSILNTYTEIIIWRAIYWALNGLKHHATLDIMQMLDIPLGKHTDIWTIWIFVEEFWYCYIFTRAVQNGNYLPIQALNILYLWTICRFQSHVNVSWSNCFWKRPFLWPSLFCSPWFTAKHFQMYGEKRKTERNTAVSKAYGRTEMRSNESTSLCTTLISNHHSVVSWDKDTNPVGW